MQGATVPAVRNPLTVRIGRNIVRARGLAGMTQHAVVRAQEDIVERDSKTGKSLERLFLATELSGWENGHRRPSDPYLIRIGRITGQPLSFFFESPDDQEV